MLAGFDAMVLSKYLARSIHVGRIVHGDRYSIVSIKLSAISTEVRRQIAKLEDLLSSASEPPLILNRHCAECEFLNHCRPKAMEKNDLSLLSALRKTEIQRLNRKGIFRVQQLSYTFRPRRRRKRMAGRPEKYQHSLRALAIRKGKIHVVGQFEFTIQGTPVYLP
jgi:predicted RecB family nuclease